MDLQTFYMNTTLLADDDAMLSRTTIGGGKKRITTAQLAAGKASPQFHHVSRQVKRAAQRKRLKAMAGGLR